MHLSPGVGESGDFVTVTVLAKGANPHDARGGGRLGKIDDVGRPNPIMVALVPGDTDN